MKEELLNVITAADTALVPDSIFELTHFVNGKWLVYDEEMALERISPATGKVVSRLSRGDEKVAKEAILAARQAFEDGRWSRLPGAKRAAILNQVADLIENKKEHFAIYETLETGKPITQARSEIDAAIDLWRFAASLARTLNGESHPNLDPDIFAFVIKEPVGVASIITPWNFPFLILSQKLPFALAAGCTAIVKPSELTSATAIMLGQLLTKANMPDGVVNIVLGLGGEVGHTLSAHSEVDVVSFTGSTNVGKLIVQASASTLKKTSLELGGKNPQVIMPDANLEEAADAIVFGTLFNAGQCCNSGSRLIVHQDIKEELLHRLGNLIRKVPIGNPLNSQTKVGAIISDEHSESIDACIRSLSQTNAKIFVGGRPLLLEGLTGRFYEPTIVVDVDPAMDVSRQEIFGPVLSVLTFETFDQAVQLANDTSYGLSAGIWSENVHTCLSFIRQVKAGTVWTNTWMDGFPELPFGGVKESGIGRELGKYGIEEFLELKTCQMRVGATREKWV